jgi:WD40 repeat protein
VTAGSDGRAKVWQIEADIVTEIVTLAVGKTMIGTAMAPEGDRVVTSDSSFEARIWDLTSQGDAEWLNVASGGPFPAVTFSPDGAGLLVSGDQGLTDVWTQAGAQAASLVGPESDTVISIDVNPDGTLIATGGGAGVVRVWDAKTARPVFAVEHEEGFVVGKWSPDGELLVTSGDDAVINLVDRKGSVVRSMRERPGDGDGPEPRVSGAVFTPDGRNMVTAVATGGATAEEQREGGWVTVWDVETGVENRRIATGASFGLAVDVSGDRVITGNYEDAYVWALDSGERLATLGGHSGQVWALAVHPTGDRIVTSSDDGVVRVWDSASYEERLSLEGHTGPVYQVAFSHDGRRLASVSPDGTARVWAMDLDDLFAIAREEVTRSLTDEECSQYLHVDSCNDL